MGSVAEKAQRCVERRTSLTPWQQTARAESNPSTPPGTCVGLMMWPAVISHMKSPSCPPLPQRPALPSPLTLRGETEPHPPPLNKAPVPMPSWTVPVQEQLEAALHVAKRALHHEVLKEDLLPPILPQKQKRYPPHLHRVFIKRAEPGAHEEQDPELGGQSKKTGHLRVARPEDRQRENKLVYLR